MADLTTLDNVKAYMQIADTDTSSDEVLERLITSFSAWFINQVNRDSLLTDDYVERRNGQGGDSMTMRRYPVQSVASVTIDGHPIAASADGSHGFVFDEFSVFLIGDTFRRGRQNVAVSYTAGYDTVPADIEQAVIDQVVFTHRRAPNLGSTAQTQGGILTASFSQKDLAPGVAAVIANYKSRTMVGL